MIFVAGRSKNPPLYMYVTERKQNFLPRGLSYSARISRGDARTRSRNPTIRTCRTPTMSIERACLFDPLFWAGVVTGRLLHFHRTDPAQFRPAIHSFLVYPGQAAPLIGRPRGRPIKKKVF